MIIPAHQSPIMGILPLLLASSCGDPITKRSCFARGMSSGVAVIALAWRMP